MAERAVNHSIDELKENVQEILRTHSPLPLDEDVERELEMIEQRARDGTSVIQQKG